MINNISPSYLSDLVPYSVNTISHYNLRNADDLESVASRTNQYYNSFLPSHYENMPIQKYWKIYHQKMKIFR